MQFGRVDRPAETVDFVLAFWPHSDLLAKMPTVSARPVYYSTAGLLDRRVIKKVKSSQQSVSNFSYQLAIDQSITYSLPPLPVVYINAFFLFLNPFGKLIQGWLHFLRGNCVNLRLV